MSTTITSPATITINGNPIDMSKSDAGVMFPGPIGFELQQLFAHFPESVMFSRAISYINRLSRLNIHPKARLLLENLNSFLKNEMGKEQLLYNFHSLEEEMVYENFLSDETNSLEAAKEAILSVGCMAISNHVNKQIYARRALTYTAEALKEDPKAYYDEIINSFTETEKLVYDIETEE